MYIEQIHMRHHRAWVCQCMRFYAPSSVHKKNKILSAGSRRNRDRLADMTTAAPMVTSEFGTSVSGCCGLGGDRCGKDHAVIKRRRRSVAIRLRTGIHWTQHQIVARIRVQVSRRAV